MLTSAKVKDFARNAGADIVGITSMDRFEGAPLQMDPRQISPEAKSMIVLGFRILRGSLRGIEEGTYFIAYSSMGYAGINFIRQPMVIWDICNMIEDCGYEAIPIPNNFPWTGTSMSGIDPRDTGKPREGWSRPVSPERPCPDVFPHLRIAAYCAGLGEIGYSKMFLTPEFGPRQRLAAIITDARLDEDDIFGGGLCDRCMLCARDCTGQAISTDETVRVKIAGREVEWGKIDFEKCGKYFCGASRAHNPFIVSGEDEEKFNPPGPGGSQSYKVHPIYSYGRALEGARGCIRACMIHLEEQGKIKNKFSSPFRRRKPWVL